MKQRSSSKLLILLFAAFALILASCASSDSDGGGSEPSSGGGGGSEAAATCQGTPGETQEPSDLGGEGEAPDGSGLKVGLVFDIGGKDDKSFNESAYNGLVAAEENMGIEGTELEPNADGSNREDLLRQSAEDGDDLVIGVGFNFFDPMTAVAADYPDTKFAIIDSVVEADNVASITFAEEQGSYLVGAIAAQSTQTDTIGFVGGVETDLIKKFEAGYAAGAKAVNPDIEILAQYVSQPPDFSGFNDAAKGKEIAGAMYADGADVVYQAAGATGLGVFEAAKDAGEPGSVWAIGVDSDQYLTVSAELQPYILTSMLKRVDVAVFETIKAFTEGTFTPGAQVFDLAADGVGYATSGGFVDDIAADLDAFAEQIKSGEIEVPTAP